MNENNDKPVIEAAKAKAASRAKRIKFIVLMSTTMASLFGLAAGSFAWFLEVSNESKISAVAGDMDVQIGKVTAYKNIYPYITGSAEFIDYKESPTLKGYVIQDSSVVFAPTKPVAKTTTISFGDNVTVRPESSAAAGAQNVTYTNESFRYYLVGDDTFNAVEKKGWSTEAGVPFSYDQNLSANTYASVSNVVLSAGSEFIFYDKNNRGNNNSCTYFTYQTPSVPSNSEAPFEVVAINNKNAYIRCLKSGVYDIKCNSAGLTITNSRTDDALIGNSMFDPTNVILEYEASSPKLPKLADYIPQGIFEQNTAVIFDVELTYTNTANPIDAGLKIKRGSTSKINELDAKYNDTRNHRAGYQVVDGVVHRNALDASDFYSFYAVFAKESNKFVDVEAENEGDSDIPAREVMWNALHQKTNEPGFRAFQVSPSFEESITYGLNPKETTGANADSTLVPPNSNTKYHCYITVDYDYSHVQFFFNQDRLGKTFLLDRDFGFYFTSTQHLESDQS